MYTSGAARSKNEISPRMNTDHTDLEFQIRPNLLSVVRVDLRYSSEPGLRGELLASSAERIPRGKVRRRFGAKRHTDERQRSRAIRKRALGHGGAAAAPARHRSEEHTSELQSPD